METSTSLSLGQAARLAGVGKTTLARAIRAGRLSATRRDDGGYSIEPCELARVFPIQAPAPPVAATVSGAAVASPTVQSATDPTADALVAALRETIAVLKAENTDLRQERDRFRDERDQAQRLVLPPPQRVETPPARWRWWRRAAG